MGKNPNANRKQSEWTNTLLQETKKKKKKERNSGQWGRADHCWGTVTAKSLASEADIERTSRRHRSPYTGFL